MNDSGDVVGTSRDAQSEYRAFLYTAGGDLYDLNDVVSAAGVLPPGATLYAPRDINNRGQIVGHYLSAAGSGVFRYTPAQGETAAEFLDLGEGSAVAINENGDVLKRSSVYIDGVGEFNLPTTSDGRTWTPTAISGEYVSGYAYIPGTSRTEAVRYTLGESLAEPLGFLDPKSASRSSFGSDVNAFGTVAGHSSNPGRWTGAHAVLFFADGTLKDLGTLGGRSSSAVAINSSGDAAGYSDDGTSDVPAIFVWHAIDGTMKKVTITNLSESGLSYGDVHVRWINSAGVMCGTSGQALGARATILTPVQ